MGFLNVDCPECESESAYFNGLNYQCPNCDYEWEEHRLIIDEDDDDWDGLDYEDHCPDDDSDDFDDHFQDDYDG